jgi:hypothetical protein
MNAEQFEKLTRHAPENDDLERVNCDTPGVLGHDSCGVCERCGWPRFIPNFDGRKLVCHHRTEAQQ